MATSPVMLKSAGAVGKSVAKPAQITNPATGRMVSAHGRLGKEIAKRNALMKKGLPTYKAKDRTSSPTKATALDKDPVIVPTTPVRVGVVVKNTSIVDPKGNRLKFHGLWAMEPVPAGGFIGFYLGRAVYAKDGVQATVPKGEHYAFRVDNDLFTVFPRRENGQVSPYTNPSAMINEPPKGTTANCCFYTWMEERHIIPYSKRKDAVYAIAVHATRAIKAGEELFVHYGDTYIRSHYPKFARTVGKASYLRQSQLEKPGDYFTLLDKDVPKDAIF